MSIKTLALSAAVFATVTAASFGDIASARDNGGGANGGGGAAGASSGAGAGGGGLSPSHIASVPASFTHGRRPNPAPPVVAVRGRPSSGIHCANGLNPIGYMACTER